MPPGFPAGLSFMLGLRSGPSGPLGHLSPTPNPGSSPSAPPGSGAFSTAQLKHVEAMMSSNRNYSEYMRSLAAKYNSATNDSFPSSSPFCPPTPPMRPPLPRSPDCPPSPASRPAIGSHSSARAAADRHPSPQRSPPSSFTLADFPSSQTLLNLVRTHAQSSQLESYLKGAVKRSSSSTQEGDPLDLSLSGPPMKSARSPSLSPASTKEHHSYLGVQQDLQPDSRTSRCSSAGCPNREHQSKFLARWSVDDVVNFVQSIDVCASYAEKFRDQSIDGSILSVLTEDHLTAYMGMRLGPAIKLRQGLANMTGHCSVCLHCLHCRGPPKSPIAPNTRASSASPSPHSSPAASPKDPDLLVGQPTPASSSSSPSPSHASSPTDTTASN
ncbi:sterile alpha motif domain-containing protein 11-like [Galendromus occidentalis]|uniref:Sterile alpha motif domain-containing protein 11-like n=1 Tax=Galendromus occidentalis TaxID=34638 RepID=A0AAJ7SF14_9ACAR|nr:sterile alpha motif domain-containing protein 11-like [Galendromus occidentalis]